MYKGFDANENICLLFEDEDITTAPHFMLYCKDREVYNGKRFVASSLSVKEAKKLARFIEDWLIQIDLYKQIKD